MSNVSRMEREFTGRHMALIIVAFFSVIVCVNVTMAMLARSSWTGLVVRNTYVASQEFNGKVAAAREQAALGWTARLEIGSGRVTLALTDGDSRVIALRKAILNLRSPATDREDVTVPLAAERGVHVGDLSLRDGVWVAEVVATAADGREWHDTRRVLVKGGRIE